MKRLVLVAVLAACYDPKQIRRESSQPTDDAGERLRAAMAPAPTGPTNDQRFKQHYDAGLAFYEGKQFPEAIAEFEAAYAVDGQPVLLFNIGQAYRKAGKLELALAKYREYLERDPSAERAKVDQFINEVEAKLGKRKKTSRR